MTSIFYNMKYEEGSHPKGDLNFSALYTILVNLAKVSMVSPTAPLLAPHLLLAG